MERLEILETGYWRDWRRETEDTGDRRWETGEGRKKTEENRHEKG